MELEALDAKVAEICKLVSARLRTVGETDPTVEVNLTFGTPPCAHVDVKFEGTWDRLFTEEASADNANIEGALDKAVARARSGELKIGSIRSMTYVTIPVVPA